MENEREPTLGQPIGYGRRGSIQDGGGQAGVLGIVRASHARPGLLQRTLQIKQYDWLILDHEDRVS